MVARNIIAVLLFLALIGRRVDCQLEDAESQNRLCPALYGEGNLHSFLYLSDIVFYGKVLETYKGTVPGTLVAKVRYFLYYKGELPRTKSFAKRFIFVENFSDGSHTCLPQVESRQAMLFFVSILSGRYVINGLESTAGVLDHLDLIDEVSQAENKRILEFMPPPVDPCQSREANNCSDSAVCDTLNPQPGLAYRCVCNIGYYGNGFRCEAVATVMNKSRNIPELPELPIGFFSSSVAQEPTSAVYPVSSSIDQTSDVYPVSSSIDQTSDVYPVSSSIDQTSDVYPVSSSIDQTSDVYPVSSSIDRTSDVYPVSSSIDQTSDVYPVSSSIDRTSDVYPVSSSIDWTSDVYPVSSSIDRTSDVYPVSSSIDRTSDVYPVSSSINRTSVVYSVSSSIDRTSDVYSVSSSIDQTSVIYPVSSSIDRTSDVYSVSSSIDQTSVIYPVSSSIDQTSEIHPVSTSISPTSSLFHSTTFFDQSTSKKLSVVDTRFVQSTVLPTPSASSPATPTIPPPLLTPSSGSGSSGFPEDDVVIAEDQEMDDV